MSTILLVEQSNPGVQAATQQVIYPKIGQLARVDSTGVEKIILDSATYAAAVSATLTQVTYFGA